MSQPWAEVSKSGADAPPPYNPPVNQAMYGPPPTQSYPPPNQQYPPPNNQPNYQPGYPPNNQYPPQNQPAYPPNNQSYPPPNNQYPPQPSNQYPPQQPGYPPNPHYGGSGAGFAPNKMERFQQLCRQHEISDFFAAKLRSLSGFEIVIVADDSGSMTSPINNAMTVNNPFAPSYTRWDELKQSCSVIVSLAGLFDDNGLDVYFLNRPPVCGVRDPSQLGPVFAQPPSGFTPTAAALHAVFQAKRAAMAEKKLLVVILTDGQPTDPQGNIDIRGLEGLLHNRPPQSYITIVACTDDHSVMDYLNGWDQRIPRLDVVDDYMSEKREIQAARGPQFNFSYGDYIVKLLLGTIDPVMDRLDEKHRPPYQMPATHAPYSGGQPHYQPQYQPQYQQPQYGPPPTSMQAAYQQSAFNMPPTNVGQWQGGYY